MGKYRITNFPNGAVEKVWLPDVPKVLEPPVRKIGSKDFRRKLTRTERSALRHGGTDKLEELREELSYGAIENDDPYIRDLVESIPGVGPVRLAELLD